MSEKQAQILDLKAHSQWSPYLEKCCLLLSANESYERAAQDIQVLTGVAVSRGTQQRLVHRQTFELPEVESPVAEMSIDGGKARLRTPEGQPSEWRDYKGVNLHECCIEAFFQDNGTLVDWVNEQPLSTPLICVGDGHAGVWNLFSEIGSETQRREILDWYHLMENLGKVGESQPWLERVEACLWKGDIDGAIEQLQGSQDEQASKFMGYLNNHRHRIVNYEYYQAEGISIGSGAIESSVKQIGRRIKISGAQWNKDNIAQVLKHRCAYLNGQFSK